MSGRDIVLQVQRAVLVQALEQWGRPRPSSEHEILALDPLLCDFLVMAMPHSYRRYIMVVVTSNGAELMVEDEMDPMLPALPIQPGAELLRVPTRSQ